MWKSLQVEKVGITFAPEYYIHVMNRDISTNLGRLVSPPGRRIFLDSVGVSERITFAGIRKVTRLSKVNM